MFNFLDDARLFQAFYGFNDRFNALLLSSRRHYHFDFQSISQRSFAHIFGQHISIVDDRIVVLRISDDDETPGLIEHFLRRRLSLASFSNLRSLTFTHIPSYECLREVIDRCHTVPNLTELRLEQCRMGLDIDQYESITRDIYSLPRLVHCHLDINCIQQLPAVAPTRALPALQRLTIESAEMSTDTLTTIATNAPQLRHFAIRIDVSFGEVRFVCPLEWLVTFKLYTRYAISDKNSFSDARDSIWRCMPNLKHLQVESFSLYTDDASRLYLENDKKPIYYKDSINNLLAINDSGRQWETVICSFLRKLETFQLKMQYYHWVHRMRSPQADALLQSFSSHFWTHERRWFVRCEWSVDPSSHYFCLYTLPCIFTRYTTPHPVLMSTSTSPTELDYYRSDQLQHPISFSNERDMSIVLPARSVAHATVTTLDRLHSLSVFLRDDSTEAHEQLQSLVDRAPYLYALKISCGTLTGATMDSLRIHSPSVRRLDLLDYTEHEGWQWFSGQQRTALSESSLGARCEMLRINVANLMDVVDLVYAMPNLRALSVQIESDPYRTCETRPSADEDEVLDFFRGFFDPTCTVRRNQWDSGLIQLWIR
jgi:hypothetical protein